VVNLTGCGEWFGSSRVEIRAIENECLGKFAWQKTRQFDRRQTLAVLRSEAGHGKRPEAQERWPFKP